MRWRGLGPATTVIIVLAVAGLFEACGSTSSSAVVLSSGRGPAKPYDCSYDPSTEAFTGADGTASAIGWEANHQGVVTCLGGTFYVQDGINRNFGFGIYDGARTAWTDLDGYLPAQVTSFERGGASISITEFADRDVVGGHPYVAVYSRVAVQNSTDHAITADPGASIGLVPLNRVPDAVPAGSSADHDYVVAVDRFGGAYPWPNARALVATGSFNRHLAHMRSFWNRRIQEVAQIQVPDRSLVDAYRSGIITTQITRSGNHLNTGVNNYESEFSHDVVGILATLFTEGSYSDAHALLLQARNVVGSQGQYDDGIWTYDWPWAIYLLKTGDLAFVKANFATEGPNGASQPSIEDTAHRIAADRTGPSGIMGATDDIDADGYWTVDDYEALMGLAAYRYLAERVGVLSEARWATSQYDSLLAATNATLDATVARNHLDYLPCSMAEPNTANRCNNPEDANWAAPFQFGKWAWDAQLFGAKVSGPGLSLIDATYDYGFGRLHGILPPETFGGFPNDYFSSGYNAAYGSWGLASAHHRDQGILSYEFMISRTQSGPNSWWESDSAPAPSPWVGSHPAGGQGSSPHAWGISEGNNVLLDSLAAQESDGSVIVGRGVPTAWFRDGKVVSASNFPTTDGKRMAFTITRHGRDVTLTLHGDPPPGPILFEIPLFVDNVASTSAGTIDETAGLVTVPASIRRITVGLREKEHSSPPDGDRHAVAVSVRP
jgi:hypothetical protein